MMRKLAKRNIEIGLIISLIIIGVVFFFTVAHFQGYDRIWNGLTILGIMITIVFGTIFLSALTFKRLEKQYKKRIAKATLEKEINQYITLKLEHGRTHIYVKGRRFIQCIRLILNVPKENIPEYDEIESIDEAAKLYSTHIHQNRIIREPLIGPRLDSVHDITPEQEFWGHCSNIQAWVELDYDTRILMSNISFPLLRELTKAGDPKAKQIYKEEIALRLESGYPSVVQYLLTQGYLQVFSSEEFQSIIESTDLIKNTVTNPKIMALFLRSCVFKFPTLLEIILLHLFRQPNGKKIILSSMESDPRIAMLRPSLIFRRPEFLSTLKFALKRIIKRVNEKTGNDILECIRVIEKKLEGKEYSS
ncbi:MAG: hypothetical protein ACFE9S_19005, partial [Candidatus Hermodarchaeota archaeon]